MTTPKQTPCPWCGGNEGSCDSQFDGWICALPAGHTGDHLAPSDDCHAYARWPNEREAAAIPVQPTAAALRAAICASRMRNPDGFHTSAQWDEHNATLALAIDRETALPELLAALEVVRSGGMLGAHAGHWDNTMQSGGGCPVCIQQREVAQVVRAALAKAKGDGK